MRTVEAAARLARDARAALTITGAYRRMSDRDRLAISDLLGDEVYMATPTAGVDELLHMAVSRARAQGVELVRHSSLPGSAAESLLSVADRSAADLIVVGNRECQAASGRWLRSFASDVRRRSSSDLLIVRDLR